MGTTYILILNWNGWKDTIECLESVFRSDYHSHRVIVCDNDSQDGSLEHVKSWAEGRLDVALPKSNPLRHLSFPPVTKPIPYVEYDRAQAERGGNPADADCRLVLIQTGANLGFAGGNNVGLRYALARDDFQYVWILNNDTVVSPDALTRMVERMAEKPDAGMCGATLLYYDQPDRLELPGGGLYNKWFGGERAKYIGRVYPPDRLMDYESIERNMAYVNGACMLASKAFLIDVGLMSEDYFLYFEELDWAMRARGSYSLAYAPRAIVYHKEGATIQRNDGECDFDYYFVKNRLVFTRKFFPWALPTVYLGLVISLLKRIRSRRWRSAKAVLRVMCGR